MSKICAFTPDILRKQNGRDGSRSAAQKRKHRRYFLFKQAEEALADSPFIRTAPVAGPDRYGVIVSYWQGNSFLTDNGALYVSYWLNGTNQQCQLDPLLNAGVNDYMAAGVGYTNGNSAGKTHCIVHIPHRT